MHQEAILSAKQIRAARAILDWSQEDLAKASRLSVATIRKLELGNISPRGTTNQLIRQACEVAGVEFIPPNGVREIPNEITIYEGEDGTRDFYDDVFDVMSKCGGDIVSVNTDANLIYANVLKEYKQINDQRMLSIADRVSSKVLLTESRTSTPGAAFCEYRYLPQKSVLFFVYSDKSAFRLLKRDNAPHTIVIRSAELADAFREQFYAMWDRAVPVSVPPCTKGSTKHSSGVKAAR